MAQHDYVLDNNPGLAFRGDLNDALAAIMSSNSGATAPTTTTPFMLWADAANDLMKIRNAADNAWVSLFTLSAAFGGNLSLAGGTMTGALRILAGTNLLPGLTPAGDSNTGIFAPAGDELGVSVNGAEILRFAAAYIDFKSTGAIKLPLGTTAQRPTGVEGLLRANSDLTGVEVYLGAGWRGVGSGGGGAGFKWVELSGTAPTITEEAFEQVYLFGAGMAQELYASIKLPQSYTSGTPVSLYVSAYSPSTSNTILLSAQSTLIAKNSTAFTSTTNQRTSTNSALTNTVANQLREFVLDITSSTGQINGVSCAAGDVIKVRLYRGTDTDTADLRMIANGTDVKAS